jgi:predicted phage terminase large subunit-like protein
MPSSKPSSIRSEQKLRRTIRASLTDWAEHALAPIGQAPAAHHRLLLQTLQALSQGLHTRLLILMPPGSAKSTYASVLFPAWWFVQHPRSSVILASHTASLAEHFARQVRGTITEHAARLGYDLAADDRSAQRFTTTRGGEFLAAGVRGAIIGRRADLVIIDDPVRSQAEADSAAARTHLHDWFRADLTSRLKPGGRVLLIMTRWHHDDLAGRLLRPGPDQLWHVLRLPALAEDGDPLGRSPGEALWPAWEDAEALAAKQRAVGPRLWAALYQQTPFLLRDALFKTTLFGVLDVLPADPANRIVRAWDLAATAQRGAHDPDWTVGLKLVRRPAGDFIVADVVRLRGDPAEVEQAIRRTAETDGRAVPIGIPQDPGQAGKAQVRALAGQLAGFRIVASREAGSKEARALPVASQVAARNVSLLRAGWNDCFLEELCDFPQGSKDDQVDALSRAFAMLTDADHPARTANIPFMAR